MASSSAAALAAEFETAKLMRECAEREVAERDAVDENGHPVMTHRAVASIVRVSRRPGESTGSAAAPARPRAVG